MPMKYRSLTHLNRTAGQWRRFLTAPMGHCSMSGISRSSTQRMVTATNQKNCRTYENVIARHTRNNMMRMRRPKSTSVAVMEKKTANNAANNAVNNAANNAAAMNKKRANLLKSNKDAYDICEVEKIARKVGVRLTPNELSLLRKKLDINGDGVITQSEIKRVGREALQHKTAREVCLSVVCTAENPADKFGVHVINVFDYSGTALFAVVGTQVAGDCGMNIIGCSLVGCAAALGGGSLNAMMYGGASPLLGQPGVRWVANPSYLLTAVVASVFTFFGWPYYCQSQANHYIENVIGSENLTENGEIGQKAFLETWRNDANFRQTIRDALPNVKPAPTSSNNIMYVSSTSENSEDDGPFYFSHIDTDSSGEIDMQELQTLVQHRFYNGWETYLLDTLGLSSLSIAAVSMSIKLGLHPVVAATSGVTVCFGGILRDLLCGRDLAIGSQSYAFATGASSSVYIFLRELAIRRILILPLAIRTFMSAGSCIGLRSWEYLRGKPLLKPMHAYMGES